MIQNTRAVEDITKFLETSTTIINSEFSKTSSKINTLADVVNERFIGCQDVFNRIFNGENHFNVIGISATSDKLKRYLSRMPFLNHKVYEFRIGKDGEWKFGMVLEKNTDVLKKKNNYWFNLDDVLIATYQTDEFKLHPRLDFTNKPKEERHYIMYYLTYSIFYSIFNLTDTEFKPYSRQK